MNALPGSSATLVSDGNAINNVTVTAFQFDGNGGTEKIYMPGSNIIGFNNAIVIGGAFTPLGTY